MASPWLRFGTNSILGEMDRDTGIPSIITAWPWHFSPATLPAFWGVILGGRAWQDVWQLSCHWLPCACHALLLPWTNAGFVQSIWIWGDSQLGKWILALGRYLRAARPQKTTKDHKRQRTIFFGGFARVCAICPTPFATLELGYILGRCHSSWCNWKSTWAGVHDKVSTLQRWNSFRNATISTGWCLSARPFSPMWLLLSKA